VRLFIIALFLLGPFINPGPAKPVSANPVKVLDAWVLYHFGQDITFQATIQSDVPIEKIFLSFQAEGEDIVLQPVNLDSDGNISFRYDIQERTIRPFSRVYYWFRFEFGDEEEYTSPSRWFDYEDNRFAWQTHENPGFSIHWYEGNNTFGQLVQNIAQDSLTSDQRLLPLPPPSPLKIYVYASPADLQSALLLGGQSWVAGYASPDLGVVVVSAPPGPEQKLELERQIPHELTHVLLYQATGENYSRLPAWLIEGLASISELYINSDYERAIQVAKEKDNLLPMSSLCGSFPQSASGNFLAYAQAASFTRFLHKHYGTSGLQSLVQGYTNGLGCDEGVQAIFGLPLNTLETRWRQESLEMNTGLIALQNLFPYLALLAVMGLAPLITIVIRGRLKRASLAAEG